jgi:uncharacterized membrane protein (DUF485 family)
MKIKRENIATHLSALFLIVFFITTAVIRYNHHNKELVSVLLPMTIITILSWVIITQKKCCQE